MLNVHFTPGDGKGWALDEDLRQTRIALCGRIRETSPAAAEIIHAPFWQNLAMVEPEILRGAFVIAHADNPPFFYVKQPEFAQGQTWVDLWVARSREAMEQFRALGLRAVYMPYTIDPGIFFSIENKKALRREFGIPDDAYVIANFHRDSEGADLNAPKFQKAPEMMVEILKRIRDAGDSFHVLLAGPRRHWIRCELERERIPFTFVGKQGIAGDDFGKNILSRKQLNRLYNTADLHLVSSRWEGGPQSAMEAAACRIKQMCPRLGVAKDILEEASLFRCAAEAAGQIGQDIRVAALNPTIAPQFERWKSSHTTQTLVAGLQKLYDELPSDSAFRSKASAIRRHGIVARIGQFGFTIRRRIAPPNIPRRAFWNHADGCSPELDGMMELVRTSLNEWGVNISPDQDADIEIIGSKTHCSSRPGKSLRFIIPGVAASDVQTGELLAVPSVQDALNLKNQGIRNPSIVMPFVSPPPQLPDQKPYLVRPGDDSASLRVWAALAGGCPVVYPESSAYYEQVFHAGIAYGGECDQENAMKRADINFRELSSLIRIPSVRESSRALRIVLADLHRRPEGILS